MDQGQWLSFVNDASAMVEHHAGVIHNRAWGTGYWNDRPEETFVVTFSGFVERALAEDLALLAFTFKQECIALIVGETTFVEAETRRVAAQA